MENQHSKIKGYRELSQEEIDLMNEIKAIGTELGSLVERLYEHAQSQIEAAHNLSTDTGDSTELDRLREAEPLHWVATGVTNAQLGLMALTRSVAQPTTF